MHKENATKTIDFFLTAEYNYLNLGKIKVRNRYTNLSRKTQIINQRGNLMLNFKKKLFAFLPLIKSRKFAISALSVAMAFVVGLMSLSVNAVYINDEGTRKLVFTMRKDVNEILKKTGVNTIPEDDICFSGFDEKVAEVTINRAFDVKITCDGIERNIVMTRGTVNDALAMAGITLGSDDLVSPPLTEEVYGGAEVIIGRVSYKTLTRTESLEYDTVLKKTSLLKVGARSSLISGENGIKTSELRQTYIDGKLISEDILKSTITKNPVAALMLVGDKVPISQYSAWGGYELGENGVPKKYKKHLVGLATAYSARPGAGTASGRKAMVGNVAVNPRVIPYGSKLYIKASNGAFVYGYAVAADTGGFASQGRIMVDLFFDTYKESCLFGLKQVDLYVLE